MIKTLIFWISFPTVLLGQTWLQIDSFKQKLVDAKDDKERLAATEGLFYVYVFSYPDSALPYAQEAIRIAHKMKSDSALAVAYAQYSTYTALTGDYPGALKNAFDALELAERNGNLILIASATA